MPEPMPEISTHYYVSTACQHGRHEECRKVCKFCPAKCACPRCQHWHTGQAESKENRDRD